MRCQLLVFGFWVLVFGCWRLVCSDYPFSRRAGQLPKTTTHRPYHSASTRSAGLCWGVKSRWRRAEPLGCRPGYHFQINIPRSQGLGQKVSKRAS
ncbi:hypothetical protein EU556_11425 [Hymenobacter fodinae]|uniref:Uncharacterized protein n=1 Tax=Hymenobacter fodinae TaxID=2510796 RepID=A0A4Z0P7P1_9BACT|nr:hypothetical protein EU556_11425 [Hymenobacter fodinae]